jgi:hypothetical protein
MRAWKCRITATSVREYLTLPATCLRPTWVPSCLVGRTPLVALEVLEVDAGRKLVVVDRHDDPIQFRLLFWRGRARAAHMGGVNWPARTCGRDDPLNRAARLRGHVTFCRHDDDGVVVTAQIRARRPRSPEAFRHTVVSDGVRERGGRRVERRGENDDDAHGLLALKGLLALYKCVRVQAGGIRRP